MKLPIIIFLGILVLATAFPEGGLEGLQEELDDLETELEELEFEMEKRDQDDEDEDLEAEAEELEFEMEKRDQDDEDEDLEAEAEDLQELNMMEKRKDMHKWCMDSCKKKGKTPKNMCWKECKKWKGITRVGK
uniref:Uncharacterized protein n=1 Tax=Branchiostoma floridae TaxID=7739 RepID=C3YMB4_BRAFL|eukprot:XP_002602696.1 hypothetical protein BRAFLDRAFT_120215 [Branchiostoma floridae]